MRLLPYFLLASVLALAIPTAAAPRAKASAAQIAGLVEDAFGSIAIDSDIEDTDVLAEVRAALDAGASPDARNDWGDTLLLQAVQNNRLSGARLLLARGADVNLPDEDGSTPLIRACSINDISADKTQSLVEFVGLLLQNKADPNRRNHAGETALTLAAAQGRGNIVQTLLRGKADFRLTNKAGATPLQLALKPVERGNVVSNWFTGPDTPLQQKMREQTQRAEEQKLRLGRANAARWLRQAGAKK